MTTTPDPTKRERRNALARAARLKRQGENRALLQEIINNVYAEARRTMQTHLWVIQTMRRRVYESRYWRMALKSDCTYLQGYAHALWDQIANREVIFVYTVENGTKTVAAGSEEIEPYYEEISAQSPSTGRHVWRNDWSKNWN